MYQVFSLVYLALVSLWCLSTEQSGKRYFLVNHYSAIFFCSNRFSGTIVSLVSARFIHWNSGMKKLMKLLTKGETPSVPHEQAQYKHML